MYRYISGFPCDISYVWDGVSHGIYFNIIHNWSSKALNLFPKPYNMSGMIEYAGSAIYEPSINPIDNHQSMQEQKTRMEKLHFLEKTPSQPIWICAQGPLGTDIVRPAPETHPQKKNIKTTKRQGHQACELSTPNPHANHR